MDEQVCLVACPRHGPRAKGYRFGGGAVGVCAECRSEGDDAICRIVTADRDQLETLQSEHEIDKIWRY